jgi:hypothetical protein
MGMVGGSALGGEGRGVAEGYAPYLGVVYCREGVLLGEKCFEGLPKGERGDALACRGHPYMFDIYLLIFLTLIHIFWQSASVK